MQGTKIWYPTIRPDDRGYFTELWKSGIGEQKFGGIQQINMSRSRAGVLRGLHLQHTEPMGKVMTVVSGAAFLAAVCCNPEDERYRDVVTVVADANKPVMFYADAGWARGFLTLEDETTVVYACTGRYNGAGELAVNPYSAGVPWPNIGEGIIVSEKDQNAKSFQEHWVESWYADTIDWKNVR